MKELICGVILTILTFTSSLTIAQDKVVVIPLVGEGKRIETETKTFQYQMLAGRFNPTVVQTADLYFASSGQYIRNRIITLGLSAQVYLPEGAEVKSVTCYSYDNDATENFTDSLWTYKFRRKGVTSTEVEDLATAVETTFDIQEDVIQSLNVSSITHPIIDNSQYLYWIYYFSKVTGLSDDLRFYGCSITYTAEVIVP